MHNESSQTERASVASNGRHAGIVIIAASALSVLAMLHHPSAASHNIADVVAEIAAKALLSEIVHGVLIALIAALLLAYIEFCLRLGLGRSLVRAGLVAYAIGVCALIGAALISGFLVSHLVQNYASANATDLDALRHLLNFSMLGNRTLANFGVTAMSAGIALWSIALLRPARGNVLLGVLGLIAGAAPVAALLLGAIKLDVFGMTAVVVCQTVWNIAVGIALIREKI